MQVGFISKTVMWIGTKGNFYFDSDTCQMVFWLIPEFPQRKE
jgi:hypothetical protein